jgi:hypothetical protein
MDRGRGLRGKGLRKGRIGDGERKRKEEGRRGRGKGVFFSLSSFF